MPNLRLPRNVIARIANNIPEAIRAFEQLFDGLDIKQDTLVSGENIKTINGQSILGDGNLVVEITSIDWTAVDNTPTTLAGYGILDAGTNLSYTPATRVIASDTGTDAVLPLFTDAEDGLVPASGGVVGTFLQADGTWAAAGSGVTQAVIAVPNVARGYAEVIHVDAAVTVTSKVTAEFAAVLDAENDIESIADNDLRVWPIPEAGQVRFVFTGKGAFVGPFTINYQVAA